MTKGELVALVAAQAGTGNSDAERVLDAFRDVVQAKVKAGDDVAYPGLGKFSRVARKARMGRNPQTGEPIKIPAKRVVKFRLAKGLKDAVLGKK